jgi:raffinose/stachyose/melibiose transport system permease protein
MRKRPGLFYINHTLVNALFWILTLVILFPIFWLIMNSLKSNSELFSDSFGFPSAWVFSNYSDAWKTGFSYFFINSFIVTGISVFCTVIFSAFCAYALTRLDIKGKKPILYLIIGGLLLSPESALISLYKLLDQLKIYNTLFALVLPYIAFRIPFAVFLMRGYFADFPRDLEDAAFIDGCGTFKTFWRILMPVSKPVIAAASIVTAISTWNEFIFALVFIENEKLITLPVGVSRFRDALQTNWTGMLAGIVIASIPMVIAFLFGAKWFIRGLTAGGIKG